MLNPLAQSAFQRIKRTLAARDELLRAMNSEQNNDVAGDAIAALDTCLLMMMAALDATARVVHQMLGLPADKTHTAGWQKKDWIKEVGRQAPALRRLVTRNSGSPGGDGLVVLVALRNTVHAEALRVTAVTQAPSTVRESLIEFPESDYQEVLAAIQRQGGLDSWGAKDIGGQILADPGVLLDRLFPLIAELISDLWRETPLGDLGLLPGDPVTEPAAWTDQAVPDSRQKIVWLMGLQR